MSSLSSISSPLARIFVCVLVGYTLFWSDLDGQVRSPLYLNELETLSVQTTDGVIAHFEVVTVTTRANQAQGLMHVRYLPLNQGMVFFYPRERVLSMWMKNTHVSLDMWFVDAGGRIAKVVSHTTPYSLESIKSDSQVRVVIEVNAGLSALLGVTKGAVITHRVFEPD